MLKQANVCASCCSLSLTVFPSNFVASWRLWAPRKRNCAMAGLVVRSYRGNRLRGGGNLSVALRILVDVNLSTIQSLGSAWYSVTWALRITLEMDSPSPRLSRTRRPHRQSPPRLANAYVCGATVLPKIRMSLRRWRTGFGHDRCCDATRCRLRQAAARTLPFLVVRRMRRLKTREFSGVAPSKLKRDGGKGNVGFLLTLGGQALDLSREIISPVRASNGSVVD